MDLRRCCRLLVIMMVVCAVAPDAEGTLIISELYYDHPGSDADHEFLELFNAGIEPVNLLGWMVEWAGSSWTDHAVALSGTVAPGRFFLIGGGLTESDFGVAPDMVAAFTFQNGGSATDGVRIRRGDYTDSVLYDAPNLNGLVADPGWSGTSFAPDVAAGHSLARAQLWYDTDAMTDFVERGAPDPDSRASPAPVNGTVPEPASALTLMIGMGWTLWRRCASRTRLGSRDSG